MKLPPRLEFPTEYWCGWESRASWLCIVQSLTALLSCTPAWHNTSSYVLPTYVLYKNHRPVQSGPATLGQGEESSGTKARIASVLSTPYGVLMQYGATQSLAKNGPATPGFVMTAPKNLLSCRASLRGSRCLRARSETRALTAQHARVFDLTSGTLAAGRWGSPPQSTALGR